MSGSGGSFTREQVADRRRRLIKDRRFDSEVAMLAGWYIGLIMVPLTVFLLPTLIEFISWSLGGSGSPIDLLDVVVTIAGVLGSWLIQLVVFERVARWLARRGKPSRRSVRSRSILDRRPLAAIAAFWAVSLPIGAACAAYIDESITSLLSPDPPLYMTSGVLGIIILLRLFRRSGHGVYCRRCGYPASLDAARCPECGRQFSSVFRLKSGRAKPDTWTVAVGLAGLAVLWTAWLVFA